MKKFLAGFCAAAIAAGCMGMTVMADTEATDKLTSYEATSDNVKLIVVLTERATQRYLAILQAVSSSNAQAQRLFSM